MTLLILSAGAFAQDVLINEVVYDSTESSDGDGEWIELCNPTSSTVDISDWEIESAGSSWSESYTFEKGTTIEPGAYLTVGAGVGVGDFAWEWSRRSPSDPTQRGCSAPVPGQCVVGRQSCLLFSCLVNLNLGYRTPEV